MLSLLFTNLYGQDDQIYQIQFTHLTSEDGLSINDVTKIIQDSRGFIWIGTSNGLNRYDGYRFKIFLPELSNPNSISGYSITSICEDNNGFIWVGTQNGLNRYDRKTNKFYRYKSDSLNAHSLSSNLVYSIYKDKEGVIWVGTLNGLNRYNPKSNDFTVFKKVSDRLNSDYINSVTDIIEDYKGNLWLGTWNGLTYMSRDGKVLKQFFAQSPNAKKFDYRETSVLFEDNLHNLWIGTNGKGIKKYNPETGKMVTYHTIQNNPHSISNGYITSIFQDNLNNIWIGTLYGLNRYNPKENNFSRILNDPDITSTIISNSISSIDEDSSGLTWVGTSSGISKFYPPTDNFKYFPINSNHPARSLISSRIITTYTDREGNIWVGTMDGLDKIKSKTGYVKHFKHEPGNPNSLSSNFIRAVYEDHNGIYWIGTNNNGLDMYNPKTGKFKLYTYNMNDLQSLSNNGVLSICEDQSGHIWLGTWWGFDRFDCKTQKFKRFLSISGNPNSVQNDLVWDIYCDSKGMLWIATNGGGVSEYNPIKGNYINFTSDSTNKYYISNNTVYSIFESSNGMMWFGTNYGLNSYDRKTGKTEAYYIKNGLSGNLIEAIQEDNQGNLWIGTDKGLSKFNYKKNKFINYTKRNGLRGLEFTPNVAAKSAEGNLYFSSKGLLYFNPDKILNEYLTAPVVFTDLKIFNKSVPITSNGILKESITSAKSISIPYSDNMFTLEFALLDYYNPRKNTFRYKLDGFDKHWNNVGTRNTATYTNLPPGKYKFFVKATNNNGLKNEKEASLNIIIIPAYYQTWWFRLLIILGFIFSIVAIFQYRTRSIKRRNKILEKRVNERTKDLDKTIKELNHEIASKDKFFSIIAHDLRSPFVALLGFSKFLVDEITVLPVDDVKIIAGNILSSAKHTFNLLENLLNWARIRTGRINFELEKVNMKDVFNEISELYKANISNKNITLTFSTEKNIDIFADVNMVQTVLRNLISNAIKFTKHNGRVDVYAKEENDSIKISVADTGIGMRPEKVNKLFQIDQNISSKGTDNEEGSGLGLILCKEFVELNNGTIHVKSKYGKGSEFSFILPKYKEELQYSK